MNFYKETNLQDSQIGRIPSDWDNRELGDDSIASIIAGQSPPSSTYSKENQGLPFLQGKTEFGVTFPSPTVYCSKPIKVAKKNDILLSVRAPVGAVNIAPFECCIGRGLAAIRTQRGRLSHQFLFHYLRLEGKRFDALSTGSTFKAIRMKEIEKFPIPLPPMPEQEAIVGVLGVVDSAIELADQVIAKTERLKKGLMQQLLTHGIEHTEYKNTPIGKIPKTWAVVTIGDACEQRKEIFYPSENDTYTFVGLEHIDSGETKIHNYARNASIKSSKFKFYPEDILYGKLRPYLDKAALVDFGGICSTDLLVLKTKKDVLEEFLVYVIHSKEFLKHAISSTSGTNHPRTSWKAISGFKFGLPKIAEQNKIAETFSAVDRKLEIEKTEKIGLERIKRGLMSLLLTGKVRVKVD